MKRSKPKFNLWIIGSIIFILCCSYQISSCVLKPQTLDLVFAQHVTEAPRKPVNIGNEFEEFVDFYVYFSSEEPFGKNLVTVSIFGKAEGSNEVSLLDRGGLDINPEWDVGVLPINLPKGEYTFVIDFGDGLKASGDVFIYPPSLKD